MTTTELTNFYPSTPIIPIGYDQNIDHESVNDRINQVNTAVNNFSYELYSLLKNSPEHLAKFFQYAADPYYFKKFEVSSPNLYTFTDFFDIDGSKNQYVGWKVLSFPDVTITSASQYYGIVFIKNPNAVDTIKLPESAYTISTKLSGARILINPAKFTLVEGSTVYFLVFKHISDTGPFVFSSKTVDINFQKNIFFPVTVNNQGIWTTDYLTVFFKPLNTNLYRPLDNSYGYTFVENGLGQIECRVARLDGGNVEQGTYSALNTLEPFNFSAYIKMNEFGVISHSESSNGLGDNSYTHSSAIFGSINAGSQYSLSIPLIKKIVDGVKYPVPYNSTKDFYVFVNDIKLIPDEDFTIVESAADASCIQINKVIVSKKDGINVRVIKNMPVVQSNQYFILDNFDQYGNETTNKLATVMSAQSCICFSNRHFVEPNQINYIINNLTNFSFVKYNHLELISTFFVNKSVRAFIDEFLAGKMEYEKFLEFLNKTDQTEMINNFITNRNLPVLSFLPVTDYSAENIPQFIGVTDLWLLEGYVSDITVNTLNATSIKWTYEGGVPATIVNDTSFTVKITPLDTKTVRYMALRATIFSENGLSNSKIFKFNVFPINHDPIPTSFVTPITVVKGTSFDIDVRQVTDGDASTINGFNISVNNGAIVRNKTQFTCTVDTTAVNTSPVTLNFDVYDKEYTDTFLPGLPFAGLGYDLEVGRENTIGGEDGFVSFTRNVEITGV